MAGKVQPTVEILLGGLMTSAFYTQLFVSASYPSLGTMDIYCGLLILTNVKRLCTACIISYTNKRTEQRCRMMNNFENHLT